MTYPEDDRITVCEKNFIYQSPHESAVLDMTNTETALFAVNLDYCRKRGLNPMTRVAIDRIAELSETILRSSR